MNKLLQDLRYAARMLLKTPGFTVVALITLALAIGANTAIFSIADGMLFEPLPFPDSGRLMQVMRGFKEGKSPSVSVPKLVFWQDHNDVFEGMAGYDILGSGFNMSGDGTPERIVGSRVTGNFFHVFRVQPAVGRDFLPEEDHPGAPKSVILSDGLWKRRFGGDRGIVGRSILLNGERYAVVGVAPSWFKYPTQAELWTPFCFDRNSREKAHYFFVTGRLKPGVSLERAQAAMKVTGKQFVQAFPGEIDPQESIAVTTMRDALYGQLKPALLILLGVVGFVLLIACVNLANLQLARSAARQREIAIRTVLGASSARLVRQLLTESLLLSVAGGLIGLALGAMTIKPLMSLAPAFLQQVNPIGVNASVLAFTLGVSLLAGLLFGLAPAFQASRADLTDPLKESSRSTSSRKGMMLRRALVVLEVAFALVPLTGAALLVRSFNGVLNVDPGFKPDRVVTMKLSLPDNRYGRPEALDLLARNVLERIQAVPGVRKASFATSLPLEPGPDLPFTIEGKFVSKDSEQGVGEAQYRAVSADFFQTLSVPVVRGRAFATADDAHALPVALINEAAAKKFWPKEDPIGQRITLGQPYLPELADPTPRTIIGVVRNVRENGLDEEAPEIVYVPFGQISPALAPMLVRLLPVSLAVRTDGEPGKLVSALEKQVWQVDPQQPVNDVRLMTEVVDRSVGAQRFTAMLVGFLALLALLLAAVGIYGVLSYLVHQRTREIGVRMALGATGRDVLGMVVRQGFFSVLIGVAAGLGGAYLLARVLGAQLAGLLVQVKATDPLTFVVAPAILALVALVASVLPAQRASQLDPVIALRKD
jgi:predicted permease